MFVSETRPVELTDTPTFATPPAIAGDSLIWPATAPLVFFSCADTFTFCAVASVGDAIAA